MSLLPSKHGRRSTASNRAKPSASRPPSSIPHVLDKSELDFGFTDASAFEDIESGEQMPVVPDAFRKEYQSLVRAHLDALQQRFSANRIDYTVLNTSKPLDHALYSYLSARARMMKVR